MAVEQSSFVGAGPPLQAEAQLPGQFTQETAAAHPVPLIVPSLLNLNVKHPVLAVTIPGLVVPK